jgi:hypothetical protein
LLNRTEDQLEPVHYVWVPDNGGNAVHGNIQWVRGTVVRRLEELQVLEFGASEGPDRQTTWKLFAFSTSARPGARANTRTGGGRPLDCTNLVMVSSDVLGTARE